MNLHAKLLTRAEAGRPIRVGMIGAGKFGTMFLAQARRLKGIHVVGIADLNPQRAKDALALTGWEAERMAAPSLAEATREGSTHLTDDALGLIGSAEVEVVVECTGAPMAAVRHCLAAYGAGKHVVCATVEADAFCGPALAARAAEAGVIHSMAYGDQPALVADLVDWARACGFDVAAAGRGHKWLPHYRLSTPETVWDHWGLTAEQAERGRLNPKMFNAFLDGSKPAIESAAICNACGLDAPSKGLAYPPGGVDDIPSLMRPRDLGGALEARGQVEVISSLTREGEPIAYDIRKGVWVCIEADTDYVRNCFEEYKVVTDDTGRFTSLYKRWHLIGLELGVSVASVGLRGEATGAAREWRADCAAQAKRALSPGDMLDGEGGATVSGALRPASASLAQRLVPLGLLDGAKVVRKVAADTLLTWDDVEVPEGPALDLRRAMEVEVAPAA